MKLTYWWSHQLIYLLSKCLLRQHFVGFQRFICHSSVSRKFETFPIRPTQASFDYITLNYTLNSEVWSEFDCKRKWTTWKLRKGKLQNRKCENKRNANVCFIAFHCLICKQLFQFISGQILACEHPPERIVNN